MAHVPELTLHRWQALVWLHHNPEYLVTFFHQFLHWNCSEFAVPYYTFYGYFLKSLLKEVQLLPVTHETLSRGKVELLAFTTFFQWSLLNLVKTGGIGNGDGSQVQIPLFAQPGSYFIITTGGDAAGYKLSVMEHPTQSLISNQAESAYTNDGTVWTFDAEAGDDAPITAEKAQFWRFEGEAGSLISVLIDAEEEPLFPYLELRDGEGQYILTSSSVGYGLSAQIPIYMLPETGSYYIYTASLDGSAGSYSLAIEPAEVAEIGTDPEHSTTSANPLWQFMGKAGDRVTIDLMESPDALFDSFLRLYCSGWTAIGK